MTGDEAAMRAGRAMAKNNMKMLGFIDLELSSDYNKARKQLEAAARQRKNPNSASSLFKLGYDTTLQAERAEMEAQRLALQKTRALMTSTARQ